MAKLKDLRARERVTKPKEVHTGADRLHRGTNIDRIKVHRDLFTRRLQGGAPATSEAYARAVTQWQQLPGAVLRVAMPEKSSIRRPPTHFEPSMTVAPQENGSWNEKTQ
jgi:hypothetical protein